MNTRRVFLEALFFAATINAKIPNSYAQNLKFPQSSALRITKLKRIFLMESIMPLLICVSLIISIT